MFGFWWHGDDYNEESQNKYKSLNYAHIQLLAVLKNVGHKRAYL